MKALRTSEGLSRTAGEHADDDEEPTRREELIRTAMDLFARNGYKGTSIRNTAKTLGVSVSNIYNYFENKERLWSAVLEYAIKGLPGLLRAVWQLELDPIERFRLLITTHLARSGTHQKESQMFFSSTRTTCRRRPTTRTGSSRPRSSISMSRLWRKCAAPGT
ncbi:MAG: TetR/AcrR family transcriptional regulator [Deltaproteobacteria bacterium]|nr:TetR/AcrR family transcriptional regulator [Deltaproteobacteria bacterium]